MSVVDQATPALITIGADGSVGADFSGHIHAAGLDLDAATLAAVPDTDKVRWLRTTDGGVVADIGAFNDPILVTGSSLTLESVNPDNTAKKARVVINSGDVGGAVIPNLQAIAGGAQIEIIGSDNSSGFLQRGTGGGIGRAVVQWGIGTAVFPGGTAESNTTTINLAGGAGTFTNAYYQATAIESPGNARFAFVLNTNIGDFGVRLYSTVGTPPANAQELFYWLAIQTQ